MLFVSHHRRDAIFSSALLDAVGGRALCDIHFSIFFLSFQLCLATAGVSLSTLLLFRKKMTVMDYIQSLSRALAIKQNYLDALNNYNQTVVEIEQITGKIQ